MAASRQAKSLQTVRRVLLEIKKGLSIGVPLIDFLLRYLCTARNKIRAVRSLAGGDVIEPIGSLHGAAAEIPSLGSAGTSQ